MSAALCRHFGRCGGCAFQDLPSDAYRATKQGLVTEALARHGLGNVVVEAPRDVPPMTRRRAALKAARRNGAVHIGFHAERSHDIVDMQECFVLTPALTHVLPALRQILAGLLREGEETELRLTDTESGIDIALATLSARPALAVTAFARAAQEFRIARVTKGREIVTQLRTPTAAFDGIRVALPPDVFLQPTRAGEGLLQQLVLANLGKARSVVDLFAGCGTFALPLARKLRVHAVDSDARALAALQDAARDTQKLKPVTVETRDLFRHPLQPRELDAFDMVLLDPPRAGASAQMQQIAGSKVKRVVYVSCNPESFARDARLLVAGGFAPGPVTPVDQFLWSSHIELVCVFRRL
ncbi:MAG TPA: RsmD family RNA methyltransferase [Rhizomicrobium sp.]|jgi:23S rRNA (uracil1939-C5)-methyltransferase